MYSDDDKNNIKLIEQVLTDAMTNILRRLRMGIADWDLDVSLRNALINPSNLDKIKDLLKTYDKTYELAIKSKLQINPKFAALYKIK